MENIICGDNVTILQMFPNEVFDMFLTSPPYDNLRDYNGYAFQFEKLAYGLYRVLKPGGVGVWIVGDATVNGSETLTSFKQALYFKEEVGFNLHDTMIFLRSARYPDNKRYYATFEYMFILSKETPKTFNPIQDRINSHRHKTITGTERKKDGSMRISSGALKQRKIKQKGIRNNVWYYPCGYLCSTTDKEAFQHPAIFPDKLARDHILSWSNPDDIILDPMCGSGTTCKAASALDRQYIGIDCSEKYCRLAQQRIQNYTQKEMFV